MSSDTAPQAEEKKAEQPLGTALTILDFAHKNWCYLSQWLYSHQVNLVKNYLWLCVTFITAQAGLFVTFVRPVLTGSCLILNSGVLMLSTAFLLSVSALLLGTFSLSSISLPRHGKHPHEADNCGDIIRRLIEHGTNKVMMENIEILADWYDQSCRDYENIAIRRGLYLRWQCGLCIASVILTLCAFLYFVF